MADAKLLRFGFPFNANNGLTFASIAVDNSAASQVEFFLQMPEAATITQIGIRLTSITGTSPTYKASLQGVTDGAPDGTIKGGGTPASVTFSPSGLGWSSNSYHILTLDNAYTNTRGEILCIVVAYDSGTINTSNRATFSQLSGGTINYDFPYAASFLSPTRTKVGGGVPAVALYSASKVYGFPMSAVYTSSQTSATNPNEVGLAFLLPTNFCSTYKVKGVRGIIGLTSGNVIRVQLYDGTTVLQTIDWDTDTASNSGAQRLLEILFQESTLSTLNAGTTYYIGFAPQAAVASCQIAGLTVANASDMGAYPEGTDFTLATRNGGAWTAVGVSRPFIDIIVDDLTAPSGGSGIARLVGGGIVH